MFNVSNSISLLRAPLAFLFLSDSITLRGFAIIGAMITDCVDGYLARKFSSSSKLGAFLDPLMDKFFVFFALLIFLLEGRIETGQALLIICRDFAIALFAIYLSIKGKWRVYQLRSILWGKITTAMQFLILVALLLGYKPPQFLYWSFLVLAVFVLVELMRVAKETTSSNLKS